MPKSIKNLMHLGIDFWKDLEGFWKPKWNHVGTQIDQKSMPLAKSDFLKIRALPAAGAWFFWFGGSKLGAKIDQKSIKKRSQDGKATWHRFFIDFGWLGEPSLGSKIEAKPIQKGIEKKIKKRASWRHLGGGIHGRAMAAQPQAPPFHQFSKIQSPEQRPSQSSAMIHRAMH